MVRMIMLALVVAASVWLTSSNDRIAQPARSAIRPGARSGLGSGKAAAVQQWTATQPDRAARLASRQQWLNGGSWFRRGVLRPTHRAWRWGLGHTGRAIRSGAPIVWSTGVATAQGARTAWAQKREELAIDREENGPGLVERMARIVRGDLRGPGRLQRLRHDTGHDLYREIRPTYGFGCCGCGRATVDWQDKESGETYCTPCAAKLDIDDLDEVAHRRPTPEQIEEYRRSLLPALEPEADLSASPHRFDISVETEPGPDAASWSATGRHEQEFRNPPTETPEEHLRACFEFESCEECGEDWDQHSAVWVDHGHYGGRYVITGNKGPFDERTDQPRGELVDREDELENEGGLPSEQRMTCSTCREWANDRHLDSADHKRAIGVPENWTYSWRDGRYAPPNQTPSAAGGGSNDNPDGDPVLQRAQQSTQPAPGPNGGRGGTAQLDVPDLETLVHVLEQMAKIVGEAAVHLAPHAETARHLPDSLSFGAGNATMAALVACAESAPDPAAMKAWSEQTAAAAREAKNTLSATSDVLSATGVSGHTSQLGGGGQRPAAAANA